MRTLILAALAFIAINNSAMSEELIMNNGKGKHFIYNTETKEMKPVKVKDIPAKLMKKYSCARSAKYICINGTEYPR